MQEQTPFLKHKWEIREQKKRPLYSNPEGNEQSMMSSSSSRIIEQQRQASLRCLWVNIQL